MGLSSMGGAALGPTLTLVVSVVWAAPPSAGVGQSRRPPPDDGLSCNGRLVLIGDPSADVLAKCGQPAYADGYWDRWGRHRFATWVYQQPGSFPRYVRFRDDVVVSIEAGTRF